MIISEVKENLKHPPHHGETSGEHLGEQTGVFFNHFLPTQSVLYIVDSLVCRDLKSQIQV